MCWFHYILHHEMIPQLLRSLSMFLSLKIEWSGLPHTVFEILVSWFVWTIVDYNSEGSISKYQIYSALPKNGSSLNAQNRLLMWNPLTISWKMICLSRKMKNGSQVDNVNLNCIGPNHIPENIILKTIVIYFSIPATRQYPIKMST